MSSLSQEDKELLNQLNRRPDLKKRVKSILSVAADDGEGIMKADDVENRVIKEVRRTGFHGKQCFENALCPEQSDYAALSFSAQFRYSISI